MRTIGLYLKFLFSRFIFIIALCLAVFLFFFLKQKEFLLFNYSVNNPLYSFIEQSPSWLYVVQVLIVIFFLLIIVELISLISVTTRRSSAEKKNQLLHERILEVIFNYLIQDNKTRDINDFRKKAQPYLKSNHAQRVFINQLRKIITITKGEVNETCLSLYDALHFDPLIKSHFHSPYLRNKIFALKTVGDFRLTAYNKYLIHHMHSKNEMLRSEALQAYIKANSDNDLSFLLNYQEKISLWDFNIIVNVVKDRTNINFVALLESNNPLIKSLGIRLASLQKKMELKPIIVKLMDDPDEMIKEEAYLAYMAFVQEKNDYLTLMYQFSCMTKKLQTQTLNLLIDYEDKTSIYNFFEWIIENKPLEMKIRAMSKLLTMDMNLVLKYKNHPDENVRKALRQLIEFYL